MGTAFSVLIRLELSGPGVQFIADNQLYNSIITAHAIIMIFFMVEIFRLNFKSQPCLNTEKIGEDNNNILIIGESNDGSFPSAGGTGGNKNYPEPKQKYVKILVKDPFNNRDLILKVTKKQKGVYIWESLDGEHKTTLNPYFVTGFTDAEGSFIIRVNKNSSYKTGWVVRAVFSICLHIEDLPLLRACTYSIVFWINMVYNKGIKKQFSFFFCN